MNNKMRLPFELDPQIIHHIIHSQAGSIGKAIIELLMNAVDADAKKVNLILTKEGFVCADDGNGFASREDVVRYFGRFGTPHQEGDAKYGRYRLGRGQIMAHAKTMWTSKSWQMEVDTQCMGYHYELSSTTNHFAGCEIEGEWYEPFTSHELMQVLQEIRDLVKYTPVSVILNGEQITKEPTKEKWDHEDEFAYYRVKEEGAVTIYNMGVLVRHDPGHMWGAGGLIVSKQAISLNVSRTEILRKTCSTWKAIAKQFGKMAEQYSQKLGDNRKTEARREKSARALLSGEGDLQKIYRSEEVITVLPGKKHITLSSLVYTAKNWHQRRICVLESAFIVARGELLSRENIIQFVHPQTLQRFGVSTAIEFRDILARVAKNIDQFESGQPVKRWFEPVTVPDIVEFKAISDAFVERTKVVSDKTLDTVTRRAWVSLKPSLRAYTRECLRDINRREGGSERADRLQILLGESNTSDAWTDATTYIAINTDITKDLRQKPLATAGKIFALIDHEMAHNGDSIESPHDEVFYRRYHDISTIYAEFKQHLIYEWVRRYTRQMEYENNKRKSNASVMRSQIMADRLSSSREKQGLPTLDDEMQSAATHVTETPQENNHLIQLINERLVNDGMTKPPPNWEEVLTSATITEGSIEKEKARFRAVFSAVVCASAAEITEKMMNELHRVMNKDRIEEGDEWFAPTVRFVWRHECYLESAAKYRPVFRKVYASSLEIGVEELSDVEIDFITRMIIQDSEIGPDEISAQSVVAQVVRYAWDVILHDREVDRLVQSPEYDFEDTFIGVDENTGREEGIEYDIEMASGLFRIENNLRHLVREGETWDSLVMSAYAAGWSSVNKYLKWRGDS